MELGYIYRSTSALDGVDPDNCALRVSGSAGRAITGVERVPSVARVANIQRQHQGDFHQRYKGSTKETVSGSNRSEDEGD